MFKSLNCELKNLKKVHTGAEINKINFGWTSQIARLPGPGMLYAL